MANLAYEAVKAAAQLNGDRLPGYLVQGGAAIVGANALANAAQLAWQYGKRRLGGGVTTSSSSSRSGPVTWYSSDRLSSTSSGSTSRGVPTYGNYSTTTSNNYPPNIPYRRIPRGSQYVLPALARLAWNKAQRLGEKKMPYTRKRRTRYSNRRYGRLSMATRLAQSLHERKYFQSNTSAVAVVSNATFVGCEQDPQLPVANMQTLFAPVLGTDYQSRIGKRCHVMKIMIRGILYKAADTALAVAPNDTYVRLMLYIDKNANGVQSQAETLMGPALAGTVLTTAHMCMQNIANFGRFAVLKDKLIRLKVLPISNNAAATTISRGDSLQAFKLTKKFRIPIEVQFNNSNTGTCADIEANAFHLVANASVPSEWTISYECRVYYVDG